MRTLNVLFLSLLITAFAQAASPEISIQEEHIYDSLVSQLSARPAQIEQIAEHSPSGKLFVDALWDLITTRDAQRLAKMISTLSPERFELSDQIRLHILQRWPGTTELSRPLVARIVQHLKAGTLDRRTRLVLTNYRRFLLLPGELSSFAEDAPAKAFRDKTKAEIQDLFFRTPDLRGYQDGQYADGVRLFMFCRHDRRYPCRFLLKDKNNQPVYQADGTLWNQPSLGLSKYGLPYNQRNGNTPSGVYTMDSVMPIPDKQTVYGKFRRIILNFVPSSGNEDFIKQFLPASAHSADWWREGVVARDMGRNFLRIHGTGTITTTPRDPNHPLRPTSGCIMQREGSVDGHTYIDQRHLLDELMGALALPAEYDNETAILGALYVIELNNQKKSVTYQDLKNYLDL